MKIKKQFHKGMGLFLICLLFLTTISINSNAVESTKGNTIEIYKYINGKNGSERTIEVEPKDIKEKTAGAVFMLFKVMDFENSYTAEEDEINKLYGELNKLTIGQLKEKYPKNYTTPKTDSTGMTKVENLEDGRYYIIEITGEGETIAREGNTIPLQVHVPFYDKEEGLKNPLKIYPKTYVEKPPESPPNSGGEKIFKEDLSGNPLKGAQFQVFKKVDDKYEPLKIDGEIVVSTSNASGYVEFLDLPFDTYYVQERVPPEGYMRITTFFEIKITADSLNDDNVKSVPNEKVPTQPSTTTPQSPGGGTTTTSRTPSSSTGTYTTSNTPASGKTFTGEIPRTGDIQIYLYAIAGFALISIGGVLYQSDKKARIQ